MFAAVGFDYIAIAYPVIGADKWRRVAELRPPPGSPSTSAVAAEGLSGAAALAGVTISAQVDVDSGFGRCGVPMGDEDAIEALARLILELPGLHFDGLTTHRGLYFPGAADLTRQDAGRQEGELLVAAAARLRDRGIEVEQITAGGSLDGRRRRGRPGVTEVRAGSTCSTT